MDPTATWQIILNEKGTERRQAALNLLVWIANGGASPQQVGRQGGRLIYSAAMWRRLVVQRCELELQKGIDLLDVEPIMQVKTTRI